MGQKRKRSKQRLLQSEHNIRRELDLAKKKPREMVLLELMHRYRFDWNWVTDYLTEKGLELSFSQVQYKDIARLVGLNHNHMLGDIGSYKLHRSRIPTSLFKSIVEDMSILERQYGSVRDYVPLQARSQFIFPIFNRLLAQFGSAIDDMPGPVSQSWITTNESIHYHFKSFGAVVVLLVDVEILVGTGTERLNAVAQVIAECQACDWGNRQQNIRIPIYGLLFDGDQFEFFKFDGSFETPTFLQGLSDGVKQGIARPVISCRGGDWSTRFILALRPVCEIIFDLLLVGYISSLGFFHEQPECWSPDNETGRKKSGSRDQAIKFANEALEKARTADVLRKKEKIDCANSIAEEAFKALNSSLEAVQITRQKSFIMNNWSDTIDEEPCAVPFRTSAREPL